MRFVPFINGYSEEPLDGTSPWRIIQPVAVPPIENKIGIYRVGRTRQLARNPQKRFTVIQYRSAAA